MRLEDVGLEDKRGRRPYFISWSSTPSILQSCRITIPTHHFSSWHSLMTSLDDSGEKDPIDNHLKNQIDKDSFLAGWPVKTKKLISQAIITLDLDQHCFSSFGLWSWDVAPVGRRPKWRDSDSHPRVTEPHTVGGFHESLKWLVTSKAVVLLWVGWFELVHDPLVAFFTLVPWISISRPMRQRRGE